MTCMVTRQAKEMLEGAGFPKGGNTVVLGGATIAGFFAAACSLPFDFVKTRIQKMEPGPDGKFPYKGPVDCAMKTLTQEGPLKFYTGFPTYCVRCATHGAPCCWMRLLVSMMALAVPHGSPPRAATCCVLVPHSRSNASPTAGKHTRPEQ